RKRCRYRELAPQPVVAGAHPRDRPGDARHDGRGAEVDEHVEPVAQDHGLLHPQAVGFGHRHRGVDGIHLRIATRYTHAISSPWTGSRAHSSGSGMRRKRSAWTAISTLAGKIATSVAISHQPAGRLPASTPAPHDISATPLAYTSSRCAGR